MDDSRRANASLVIEAMYRVAGDPERWEQLIHALSPEEDAQDIPATDVRNLALSEDIARLVRVPGEGPQSLRAGRNDIGWAMLSARERVTAANAAAHAVMIRGLGVLTPGLVPRFDDPANAEALTQALDRVRSHGAQAIVKFDRSGDDGPCFAYVVPGRDLPGLLGRPVQSLEDADQAFALVFPAAEETSRLWTSIRQSFGLTGAEIRLARTLRDGRSLKEAADDLAVSHNTVRNQLRAIFDKMGVKRQSDLIRALTELSALAGILEARPEVPQVSPEAAAPGIQRITLDDGRVLAFRCYGDPEGRDVLYFHEGMGSSLLPPGAEAMAYDLGIRVIAPERPGFGQSDPHSDYSFDAVAEDVMTLAGRLGVQTASVLAILSGAPSALQTAARLGERARSVLICSGRPPRQTRERAGDNPLSIFRARIESNPWVVETFYAVLRMRLSPGLVNRMVERSVVHSPADQAFLSEHPEMIDFMTAYVTECLARSSRGPADEIRAFRRGRNLTAADVQAPITVWHGAEDRLAPLPDLLAYLGDKPRDVRVIEDVGYTLALKHWRDMLTFAAT
jgi:hypothetical protein